MKAFATLLERLAFTAARNAKLRILRHYLEQTPDPDRGFALAALACPPDNSSGLLGLVPAALACRPAHSPRLPALLPQ